MNILKSVFLSALSSISLFAFADIQFSGNSYPVFKVSPEKNTGLEAIYVLHDVENVSAKVAYTNDIPKWYSYGNLGGGFAEEIPNSSVENFGGISKLKTIKADTGYILELDNSRICFYIIDYSKHILDLQSIAASQIQDCDATILDLEGIGEPIKYFTINGQGKTLSREIEISYFNLEWDESSESWRQVPEAKEIDYLSSSVTLTPPVYCNTSFTISGDRFLKFWGKREKVTSNAFIPISVNVNTTAVQSDTHSDDADFKSNILKSSDTGLGGSAPSEIEFRAFGTDAMIHSEWQIAADSEFNNVINRLSGNDLDYVFRDQGNWYVRFVGSNSDGSCEVYSETYEVNIGSSELKCPNAFSPGASPGVNDEWKVAYRSILSFSCSIFDRYGNQMCHFTNPEQGWDGKYKGKLVPPGVYYYVIQAKGADGKKYNKSGDINIIRFKKNAGNGYSNESE